MHEADVARALHDAVMVVLKLGAPPLLAALAVGLLVSIIQAVTQVSEATLAFVPKVLTVFAVLVLLGPFMLGTITTYTHEVFDRMIAAGAD